MGLLSERPLAGIRAVLIDDEPDSLEALGMALQIAGAQAECVTSAEALLAVIERGGVDVVLSDLFMPEMDGCELIQKVRALPRGGSVPAIVVTAYPSIENRARCLEAGFQAMLPKPVDLDAVIRLTAEVARPS